jgi:GNAT superfamily N-acetyltransferase
VDADGAVRALEPGELRDAARTLTRAFDADPLFVFLTPRPGPRARWLEWFHTVALDEAARVGRVWVAGGADRGAIGAFPPGGFPAPLAATFGAVRFPPGLPSARLLVAGLGAEWATRRAHPPFSHVYVRVLGVAPERKGLGLGGALLTRALDWSRELGVRTYLETSNPDNLPFYRRFGFAILDELSAGGGPPIWTLATDR